jgi:hypothetical protein
LMLTPVHTCYVQAFLDWCFKSRKTKLNFMTQIKY